MAKAGRYTMNILHRNAEATGGRELHPFGSGKRSEEKHRGREEE